MTLAAPAARIRPKVPMYFLSPLDFSAGVVKMEVAVAGDSRRVLLKLSGEVFGGGEVGLDPATLEDIAAQIAAAVNQGIQVAIVVGGGNF